MNDTNEVDHNDAPEGFIAELGYEICEGCWFRNSEFPYKCCDEYKHLFKGKVCCCAENRKDGKHVIFIKK